MRDNIQQVDSIPRLPARPADSHKGLYGHVLVAGGSRGMLGAVALAANAALRGGAGLVTFAAPEPIQLAIATLCPCATSISLACDATGALTDPGIEQFRAAAAKATVLAVGPGLGAGADRVKLVRAALEQDKPLVLDADGLNNLADIPEWPAIRRCPLILTPHPGEFARLTGRPARDIQAARSAAAAQAIAQWNVRSDLPLVLVLKGEGTVITDGRRMRINATGNPGMATGGTGDVLTGLAAAMLAQHLPPFEAASLAAHVHGRAGDLAATDLSQPALIATDLLHYLPLAVKEVSD